MCNTRKEIRPWHVELRVRAIGRPAGRSEGTARADSGGGGVDPPSEAKLKRMAGATADGIPRGAWRRLGGGFSRIRVHRGRRRLTIEGDI